MKLELQKHKENIDNIQLSDAKVGIEKAKSPTDMDTSLAIYLTGKELYDNEVKKFKKEVKEIENELFKPAKAELEATKEQILNKVLETYEVHTKTWTDKETGEIKSKKENNLGSHRFSYKEAKKVVSVDYSAITREKYPQFFKEQTTWVLNTEALDEYIEEQKGNGDLPTKVVTTEPKVAITGKVFLSQYKTKGVE